MKTLHELNVFNGESVSRNVKLSRLDHDSRAYCSPWRTTSLTNIAPPSLQWSLAGLRYPLVIALTEPFWFNYITPYLSCSSRSAMPTRLPSISPLTRGASVDICCSQALHFDSSSELCDSVFAVFPLSVAATTTSPINAAHVRPRFCATQLHGWPRPLSFLGFHSSLANQPLLFPTLNSIHESHGPLRSILSHSFDLSNWRPRLKK